MNDLKQLTEEEAIALAKTEWWKSKTAEEIVKFQLFQKRLCMDFGDFHEAVEKVLGRPVWTHEFAHWNALIKEYLGKKPKPTLQEIMDLIPSKKRTIIIRAPDEEKEKKKEDDRK